MNFVISFFVFFDVYVIRDAIVHLRGGATVDVLAMRFRERRLEQELPGQ